MAEDNIYNMSQQELLDSFTPKPPEDKGFLGNLFTRRVLHPFQESLGMRESLADQYRREQIGTARLSAFQTLQEEQRRLALIETLAQRGVPKAQIENLSLSALEQVATNLASKPVTSPAGVTTQSNVLTGQQSAIIEPPREMQEFNLERRKRMQANENAAARGPLRLPFPNAASMTPIDLADEVAERASQRTMTQKRREALDARSIDRIDKIVAPVYSSMRNFGNQRASLDQLTQILDAGAQTGATQPMLAIARNFGLSLGLNVQDPTREQIFSAISNQIALPLVKSLGNNPTDTDLQLILDSAPSLSQTVEGNRLLIQTIQLKLDRDEILAKAVMDYEDQNAALLKEDPQAYRRGLDRAIIRVQNSPAYKGKTALELRANFAAHTNRPTNPEGLADKY